MTISFLAWLALYALALGFLVSAIIAALTGLVDRAIRRRALLLALTCAALAGALMFGLSCIAEPGDPEAGAVQTDRAHASGDLSPPGPGAREVLKSPAHASGDLHNRGPEAERVFAPGDSIALAGARAGPRVFRILTAVGDGDTGLAIAAGVLYRYTVSGGRYQLLEPLPGARAQGPPISREARTRAPSARSRMAAQASQARAPVASTATPVFVRHADGRVTLMLGKPNEAPGPVGQPPKLAGTPVVLHYTVPMYQAAPGRCDAPPLNPQLAHVDSIRVLAWLPMPDDSRVWDLAAWVAAQQAGRLDPVIVRTKAVAGAGPDSCALELLPVGTTVAVQAHNAVGWQKCHSNLTRGANP